MNKQNQRSSLGVTATFVGVIVLTVAATLLLSSTRVMGVQAQAGVQYKVLMYQGASPQQLEGMLNGAGPGWKLVQMAGPFVIFQK